MSTIEPTEVKLKGKVVEVIDIEKFDTVDEALVSLGDSDVLSLINRQHKADSANKCRAKYRPSTASKKKLRQLAFGLCASDPELNAQLMSKMGDFDALMAFLDEPTLVERVKNEVLANPDYDPEDVDDSNGDE